MAIVTIFGDNDGYILSWAAANYSLARSGNNLSTGTTGTLNDVGLSGCSDPFSGGTWDYIYEGFYSFDTSGVVGPTAVALSLYVRSQVMNNPGAGINEVRTYDWGATLTTADWVAGASLAALPLVASWSRPVDFHTGHWGYKEFTPNGTALLTSLNLTGFSRYIVSSSRHRLGTSSGYSSDCNNFIDTFASVRQTGTTEDPKLVITTGTTPVGAWGAIRN